MKTVTITDNDCNGTNVALTPPTTTTTTITTTTPTTTTTTTTMTIICAEGQGDDSYSFW